LRHRGAVGLVAGRHVPLIPGWIDERVGLLQCHFAAVRVVELGDELADETTEIILGKRAGGASRERGGGNENEGASVHGFASDQEADIFFSLTCIAVAT